jgi:hypothetical protein
MGRTGYDSVATAGIECSPAGGKAKNRQSVRPAIEMMGTINPSLFVVFLILQESVTEIDDFFSS